MAYDPNTDVGRELAKLDAQMSRAGESETLAEDQEYGAGGGESRRPID
jgi:hypothetical protein